MAQFTFSGRVNGGRVHGKFPRVSEENLLEGRDLPVTTDFRDPVGEILTRLGVPDLTRVFPGYELRPSAVVGALRT